LSSSSYTNQKIVQSNTATEDAMNSIQPRELKSLGDEKAIIIEAILLHEASQSGGLLRVVDWCSAADLVSDTAGILA
jgi:hypothetical protein